MSDHDFLVRDTRNPGHFWADNEVYDLFAPQLGAYGFAVYMALCRNARNGTGECAISMSHIARDLSIAKSTVHEALSRIVVLKLARLIQPGGPRLSAVYVLADVKSLTDPNFAQLRLAGRPESSVRIANEGQKSLVREANGSVRTANVIDREANAAFAIRTPNKEKKDSFKTQTKKTKLDTLPNPPLQGGNYKLRLRDHQRISRWLDRALKHSDARVGYNDQRTWAQMVRSACDFCLLSFDDAVHDLLLMDRKLWEIRFEMEGLDALVAEREELQERASV